MAAVQPFVRSLGLAIDRSSWATQPVQFRHSFPRELGGLGSEIEFHLLLMFLRLGELTTPTLTATSGVARIWALLRYLHIVADASGLRLRKGWGDVDSHLKAVASDDFGVGIAATILTDVFNYGRWVDGRQYLRDMAQAGLLAAVAGAPPKVGSMKMADYAAPAQTGKIHLIECKGTGKSRSALQLAMTTGYAQKRSLICSSRYQEQRLIGQRLVTGVLMRSESARSDSELWIHDPAPIDAQPQSLRPGTRTKAVFDPLVRGGLANAASTAGAPRLAEFINMPKEERQLVASTAIGRRAAQEALAFETGTLETFGEAKGHWLGQRASVPLWRPLEFDGGQYNYAHISVGVSKELLAAAGADGMLKSPVAADSAQFQALGDKGEVVTDGPLARIVRHNVSMSSVELTRGPERPLR